MRKAKILLVLTLALITSQLSSQSTIKDYNGNFYPTIKLKNNDVWQVKNMTHNVPGSYCNNNKDDDSCKKNGRLYTYQAAENACKYLGPGWDLPDTWDWTLLYYNFRMDDFSDSRDPEYYVKNDRWNKLVLGRESSFNARLRGRLKIEDLKGEPKLERFEEVGSFGYYHVKRLPNIAPKLIRFRKSDRSAEETGLGRKEKVEDYAYSLRCINKKNRNYSWNYALKD